MLIQTRSNIDKWNNLTNEIVEDWIRDYFDIEDEEDVDWDWINNEVGGIFLFADYFIDFNSVLKCYELNISKDKFFEWYYFCMTDQKLNISLANFILSPEEKNKKEQEYLQELKENLRIVEKKFKKALVKYGK